MVVGGLVGGYGGGVGCRCGSGVRVPVGRGWVKELVGPEVALQSHAGVGADATGVVLPGPETQ